MTKKGPMEVKKYKRVTKMIALAIQHFHKTSSPIYPPSRFSTRVADLCPPGTLEERLHCSQGSSKDAAGSPSTEALAIVDVVRGHKNDGFTFHLPSIFVTRKGINLLKSIQQIMATSVYPSFSSSFSRNTPQL
ncbi:hypothetical protein BGX23_006074 [Mortierella sp. AD031]|nr:hypothetical protein BGX23_006074 [Mortierella sp. AD031]